MTIFDLFVNDLVVGKKLLGLVGLVRDAKDGVERVAVTLMHGRGPPAKDDTRVWCHGVGFRTSDAP
jgi:hypothetical protein